MALQVQGVHFLPWQWKTYRLGLEEWELEWSLYLQDVQLVANRYPDALPIDSRELIQSRLESLPRR